jgi:hypothetical protein
LVSQKEKRGTRKNQGRGTRKKPGGREIKKESRKGGEKKGITERGKRSK